MHAIIFTPLARIEILNAQDWYENEAPGLGRRFLAALEVCVERISLTPEQFPVVYRNVRRAIFRHFPYSLLFHLAPDGGVTVIACFHGSRDPIEWQRRT